MRLVIGDRTKKVLIITVTDEEWDAVNVFSSIEPEGIKYIGHINGIKVDPKVLDEIQVADELRIEVWREKHE